MPQLETLQGWRYDPGRVEYGAVVAPASGLIHDDLRRTLYERHARNCVRLIAGRTQDGDTAQDNCHTRAAAHLDSWREEGLFQQDRPSVYVYEQSFDYYGSTRTRRGFFVRVLLSDWNEDGIHPHEKGAWDVNPQRLDRMRALRGQCEPVMAILPDSDLRVSGLVGRIAGYEPLASLEDDFGARHRLWVVDHADNISALMNAVAGRMLVVAEGHDIYATALAYRNEVRERIKLSGQKPPALGELPCDYMMTLVMPDSEPGLEVMPVHRLLRGVEGFDAALFLKRCEENFEILPVHETAAMENGLYEAKTPTIGFVAGGESCLLVLKDEMAMRQRAPLACEAWREADVSVLHLLLLEDLLRLGDDRLEAHLRYWQDLGQACEMARDGTEGVQAAFLLRPPGVKQITSIASANHLLPAQSTFFYPKIPVGFVFHLFW